MAGKSRRVAARQSQLNRRRKKQQRGPSGIPAAMPEPADPASQEESSTTTAAVATTQPVQTRSVRSYAPAAPERSPGSGRPRGLSREEAAPAYHYMGPEIRRIVVMAGIAFTVLVVLKFVL